MGICQSIDRHKIQFKIFCSLGTQDYCQINIVIFATRTIDKERLVYWVLTLATHDEQPKNSGQCNIPFLLQGERLERIVLARISI